MFGEECILNKTVAQRARKRKFHMRKKHKEAHLKTTKNKQLIETFMTKKGDAQLLKLW